MAPDPPLFKMNSCVETLPEFKRRSFRGYVPFNFTLESPKENHFTSDREKYLDEPAIFSTRGTLYAKRKAPVKIVPNYLKIAAPIGDHPHAVKVIASRIRADFPLDCKGVTDFSWQRLPYYFDDLDTYHWGIEFLERVLLHIHQENAELHLRLLRFAVHLVATDSKRAKTLAHLGRAIWSYEEVTLYGGDFLEEMVKFMTHDPNIYPKLELLANKYLQEARDSSNKRPMWHDEDFAKLTETRSKAQKDPTQASCVLKQQVDPPPAPSYRGLKTKAPEPVVIPQLALESQTPRLRSKASVEDVLKAYSRRTSLSLGIRPGLNASQPTDSGDQQQDRPSRTEVHSAQADAFDVEEIKKSSAEPSQITKEDRVPSTTHPLPKKVVPARVNAKGVERNIEILSKEKVMSGIKTEIEKEAMNQNKRQSKNMDAQNVQHSTKQAPAQESVAEDKSQKPKKSQKPRLFRSQDARNHGNPSRKLDLQNKKPEEPKRVTSETQLPTRSGSRIKVEIRRMSNSQTPEAEVAKDQNTLSQGEKSMPRLKRKKPDLKINTGIARGPSYTIVGVLEPASSKSSRSIFDEDDSILSITRDDSKPYSSDRTTSYCQKSKVAGEARGSLHLGAPIHLQAKRSNKPETTITTDMHSEGQRKMLTRDDHQVPVPIQEPEHISRGWAEYATEHPLPPVPPLWYQGHYGYGDKGREIMQSWNGSLPLMPLHQHGFGPMIQESQVAPQRYHENSQQSLDPPPGAFDSQRGKHSHHNANNNPVRGRKEWRRRYNDGHCYRGTRPPPRGSRYHDTDSGTSEHGRTRQWPESYREASAPPAQASVPPVPIFYTTNSELAYGTAYPTYPSRQLIYPDQRVEAVDFMPAQETGHLNDLRDDASATIHRQATNSDGNSSSAGENTVTPPLQMSSKDTPPSRTVTEAAELTPTPSRTIYPMEYFAKTSLEVAATSSACQVVAEPQTLLNDAIDNSKSSGSGAHEESPVMPKYDRSVEDKSAVGTRPLSKTEAGPSSSSQQIGNTDSAIEASKPQIWTDFGSLGPAHDMKESASGFPEQNSSQKQEELMPNGSAASNVVSDTNKITKQLSPNVTWAQRADPNYTGLTVLAEAAATAALVPVVEKNMDKGRNAVAVNNTGKKTVAAQKNGVSKKLTPLENVPSEDIIFSSTTVKPESKAPANSKSNIQAKSAAIPRVEQKVAENIREYEDPFKLYVSGLYLDDEKLIKIFEPYRPICISKSRPCKSLDPTKPQMSDGMMFTFASFKTVEACQEARLALSRQTREGVFLKVNRAFDKEGLPNKIDDRHTLFLPWVDETTGKPVTAGQETKRSVSGKPFQQKSGWTEVSQKGKRGSSSISLRGGQFSILASDVQGPSSQPVKSKDHEPMIRSQSLQSNTDPFSEKSKGANTTVEKLSDGRSSMHKNQLNKQQKDDFASLLDDQTVRDDSQITQSSRQSTERMPFLDRFKKEKKKIKQKDTSPARSIEERSDTASTIIGSCPDNERDTPRPTVVPCSPEVKPSNIATPTMSDSARETSPSKIVRIAEGIKSWFGGSSANGHKSNGNAEADYRAMQEQEDAATKATSNLASTEKTSPLAQSKKKKSKSKKKKSKVSLSLSQSGSIAGDEAKAMGAQRTDVSLGTVNTKSDKTAVVKDDSKDILHGEELVKQGKDIKRIMEAIHQQDQTTSEAVPGTIKGPIERKHPSLPSWIPNDSRSGLDLKSNAEALGTDKDFPRPSPENKPSDVRLRIPEDFPPLSDKAPIDAHIQRWYQIKARVISSTETTPVPTPPSSPSSPDQDKIGWDRSVTVKSANKKKRHRLSSPKKDSGSDPHANDRILDKPPTENVQPAADLVESVTTDSLDVEDQGQTG